MNKIPTYVINLERSTDRKEYMSNLLGGVPELAVSFVPAVNGIEMTAGEAYEAFDQNAAFKRYGRILRPGEVGCLLSHRKCAELLLASDNTFAMICEDDLCLQETDLQPLLSEIARLLDCSKPIIVLLSGDFWYSRKRPLTGKYKLATAKEAVCAQAYLLNRAAAERIKAMGPTYLADDWYAIRKSGIRLYAVQPHVADQNRLDFKTEISTAYTGYIKSNLSVFKLPVYVQRALYKKFLKATGHFEGKNFKW